MPFTRYIIRNEFNLADPDLYGASDKDDPEALLEGVAMAGLVGVLRQLGDLAEFAAEIFHDLHEEVMATAARGHGLTARIQQLEADVPSIEKNFLSQTNHTTSYYNKGVDWHPQMCTDENLTTQGDMPRFIRDSYEECRGPPQVFLLDKFDIGGTGACLKRYTDPSFFKAESTTSEAAMVKAQRDRRTHKIKKKGFRWRNGDTPEVLTTSHAKLHHVLREECIGNVSKDPAWHVKLKKRNLDSSKSHKSYMENFLQTMSLEDSETHEIEVGQPTLRLTYNPIGYSKHGKFNIQPVSAVGESINFSPTDLETKPRPSFKYSYDFNNREINKGSTTSLDGGNTIGNASPLRTPVTEKELGGHGENRRRNGVICASSDGIASETESYMDAYADVKSELETDNGCRPKKDNEYRPLKELHFLSIFKQGGICDSSDQVQINKNHFLDSHSVDNSNTSDDGSLSFMKETSSSSLHDVSSYDEIGTAMKHGDREAELFPYTKTYGPVMVDNCSYYPDNDETPSDQYLVANGGTVGSADTPYISEVGDVSFHKNSSHLLQSSESGLSFASTVANFNEISSQGIFDSEFSRVERNKIYGGADTTPDFPCKDGKTSVLRTTIGRRRTKVSSNNLNLEPLNASSDMDINGMLRKGYVDEVSSEIMSNEVFVSPQSAMLDTQPHDFDQGNQDRDTRSYPIHPTVVDHGLNVGNYDATVSSDVNGRSAFGEVFDGSNLIMNNPQETYGTYSAETAALPELNIGGLSTTKGEHAAANLLSENRDMEGCVRSDCLTPKRNPVDANAVERNSSCKYYYDVVVFPTGSYSPSRNGDGSQISISSPDYLHQEVESQCSIRPSYVVDPGSSSEMNKLEDFSREQDVSVKQSDQSMKPLDENHGHFVCNQASDRLHLDNIFDSTSLWGRDHDPKLMNHDSSTPTPLSQQWLLHPEESVLKMSDLHLGKFSTPNEASAADFSSLDNRRQVGSGEVMFHSDSITDKFGVFPTESGVNLEGAPSLPPQLPMQWPVGKPNDSFLFSEGETKECIMDSDGTVTPFTYSRKGTFHFTAFGETVKQPQEAQVDQGSLHTSIHYPVRFPLTTHSLPQVKDSIDMHGQHSLLTSDKITTDSSIIYPRTFLEIAQPDTLAFAKETQQPSSCLPTSWTDTDVFAMDDVQSGYTAQFPVLMLGNTATDTKETILPKPAEVIVLSVRETTQPSAPSQLLEPPLRDTVVIESNTFEVPMHSTYQSLEESNSHSKTEHVAQSAEETIIKCPEMPGPQIMNKEHPKKAVKSLVQEEIWSLGLPNCEDEKLVEKTAAKLPRRRNPLFESVDVLDRSKLKKVTPRNRPETPNVESVDDLGRSKLNRATPRNTRDTPNVDERDSILKLIRAKSFNLKPAPAAVAKLFIGGPTVNLKVCAILEKANRIRRATAGSDEEDDEWE